ncbi:MULTISPECIES: hypothetical protein [unclassified Herbaspirillum]|uniref:hypothetical protein n=1 Tax=unclassified Herbaspirillum TaxID=2624150 RepID=UPI0011678910|nr:MULTISPECIES: hypothetical protein [unclassified Herbaspirillum]MBB5391371.1 hypothetical protein [Herbaspirillum sp. SJZ102]TQK12942.1 hypothetical protein FB599_0349 [Herbaspirillum sp. SJZ130]TQK14946.1 hypothetical protein FB598_0287 [Herbaspirillum sp. SJZ106]TWC67301.1 hypothetical protein FB597_104111 [Herbaspirillum sp. SJZ099]
MQNSFDSSVNTRGQIRRAASDAASTVRATNEAATDVDNVNVFAKFMKKAEETAQAAI